MAAILGLNLIGQLYATGLFGASKGNRLTDSQRAEARRRNDHAKAMQVDAAEVLASEKPRQPSDESAPLDSASDEPAIELSPSPVDTANSSE